MKLKIGLEYSDKTPFFWAETFFSKASRKFPIGLTNMFKVSESVFFFLKPLHYPHHVEWVMVRVVEWVVEWVKNEKVEWVINRVEW